MSAAESATPLGPVMCIVGARPDFMKMALACAPVAAKKGIPVVQASGR